MKICKKFLRLALLATMVLGQVCFASAEEIKGIDPDAEVNDPIGDRIWISTLSKIYYFKKLLRKTKTIQHCNDNKCAAVESDLHVSLIGTDATPAFDGRRGQHLYLTMYNSVGAATDGKSIHLIADVMEITGAKRLKAGIYQVTYTDFWPNGNCKHATVEARIDARELSTKVRAAQTVSKSGSHIYTNPIDVTYKQLGCKDK